MADAGLHELLISLRDALANSGDVPGINCVYIGLTPDINEIPNHTQFVVVTPGEQNVVNQETFLTEGEIFLTFWSSSGLDSSKRGDYITSDSTYGLIPFATLILTELQLQFLTSGASNITAEPIRLTRWGDFRQEGKWSTCKMTIEVKYEMF